jgi:glycosyltransferase involved in cell wall biosynthesis
VPVLLDLSHTSHTRARTGVQRVARSLDAALGEACLPICHDPFEETWRPLEAWELRNLAATDPSRGRGSRWPLFARLRGRVRRAAGRPSPLDARGSFASGVIFPEIFSGSVGAALPGLFARTKGPRVALFHDALSLQFPEYSPLSTSARFPGYLQDLLRFDGVAAVSEASRKSLVDYWAWLGVKKTPTVAAIPLGIDSPPATGAAESGGTPVVLCVGSIEGRKNHAALLDACEILWAKGVRFDLRIIGLANVETGAAAIEKLNRLRAAGRPIRYDGPKGDEALEEAYRDCSFTVYPSIAEGFGLPVAESLARGKACLCRTDGAIGEIALGGGCMSLGSASAGEIAAAIGALAASPFELAQLGALARGRRFKDWPQYASELRGWMVTLRREA